jgi:hypothetical protein
MFCPETFPIILAHEPIHADAMADTSDAICLRNANGVLIIVTHCGAGATNVDLTVHEGATAVEAAAGTYPITTGAEFPIWINTLTTTTDAMVRQTDALTYQIVASAVPVVVAFYIPAAILTAGRSWVHLGASAGNAANFISALYILDGARYQQTTPPTAIV